MKGKLNPDFKKQIANIPDGANVMNCYLCGTCTAGCPVAELDSGYSPRTIMRMALLGMKDELLALKEIWKCSQCGRCTSHCPQNARPSDVIKAVRGIAVEEGAVAGDSISRITALEDEIGRLRLEKIAEALKKIEKKQTENKQKTDKQAENKPKENRQTEK